MKDKDWKAVASMDHGVAARERVNHTQICGEDVKVRLLPTVWGWSHLPSESPGHHGDEARVSPVLWTDPSVHVD